MAKSLLVSMGISCFGSSVSYMMETSEFYQFLNQLFRNCNNTTQTNLNSFSYSSDYKEKQDKFLLKIKHHRSESDEPNESKYFDDNVTKRLAYAISVGEDNKYLKYLKKSKLHVEDKSEYAKTACKLDMLEIARLIYALEKLDSERLLDKYPEVRQSLDIIKKTKSDIINILKDQSYLPTDRAVYINAVSCDQLILFVENFKKITDKIKFKYKKSRLTIQEMMKVFEKNENGEFRQQQYGLCKLLFKMFRTLDYCERKKCPNPSLLYDDASTKDVTTTEKVYSNLNKY